MKRHRFLSRKLFIFAPLLLLVVAMVACRDDATPVPAPKIDVGAISSAVAAAVAKLPAAEAPKIDSAAIQSAVEAAVKAAAPEGASAAEIEAMVQKAVAASTRLGVTSEDVAALVSEAIIRGHVRCARGFVRLADPGYRRDGVGRSGRSGRS